MSMSHKLASVVLASALAVFAATPSRAIIYPIDVQFPLVSGFPLGTLSITGSITTDGTLGSLTGHITGYSLQVTPGFGGSGFFGGPTPLRPPAPGCPISGSCVAGSAFKVEGSALTATDSGLFFDFSGSGSATFANLVWKIQSQSPVIEEQLQLRNGVEYIAFQSASHFALPPRAPSSGPVFLACCWRAVVYWGGGDAVRMLLHHRDQRDLLGRWGRRLLTA